MKFDVISMSIVSHLKQTFLQESIGKHCLVTRCCLNVGEYDFTYSIRRRSILIKIGPYPKIGSERPITFRQG